MSMPSHRALPVPVPLSAMLAAIRMSRPRPIAPGSMPAFGVHELPAVVVLVLAALGLLVPALHLPVLTVLGLRPMPVLAPLGLRSVCMLAMLSLRPVSMLSMLSRRPVPALTALPALSVHAVAVAVAVVVNVMLARGLQLVSTTARLLVGGAVALRRWGVAHIDVWGCLAFDLPASANIASRPTLCGSSAGPLSCEGAVVHIQSSRHSATYPSAHRTPQTPPSLHARASQPMAKNGLICKRGLYTSLALAPPLVDDHLHPALDHVLQHVLPPRVAARDEQRIEVHRHLGHAELLRPGRVRRRRGRARGGRVNAGRA